jgi:RNA polymerase sigma-70 factor (ECF subfamily)
MPSQDDLYKDASLTYGPVLTRLARAYEADPEERHDLLQEIHIALWRSFATFDARCSLCTWVYRVAHNAATSHVMRSRRMRSKTLVSLEEFEEQGGIAAKDDTNQSVERSQVLEHLSALIQRLNPLDRQVILLYLEGMDAASIGEITGISSGYTATKIHRIKAILADRFRKGGSDDLFVFNSLLKATTWVASSAPWIASTNTPWAWNAPRLSSRATTSHSMFRLSMEVGKARFQPTATLFRVSGARAARCR